MKEYYKGILTWIPYNQGGRKKAPPLGTRYCPQILLDNSEPYELWSVDFLCMEEENQMDIVFSFLGENAPHHALKENEQYFLCEGRKKVAVVKILGKESNYRQD